MTTEQKKECIQHQWIRVIDTKEMFSDLFVCTACGTRKKFEIVIEVRK